MRLDVTEVLSCPEFMDSFQVTRETNRHVGGGVYENVKETKTIKGVVTQVNGIDSQIIENGKFVHGSILVHTKTRLTAGFGLRAGDIVTYNNNDYLVKPTNDWSRYGKGFVSAYCELIHVGGINV